MVAALLIMGCITISNMRAGIFLHKLILLEACPKLKPWDSIANFPNSSSLPCRMGHFAS